MPSSPSLGLGLTLHPDPEYLELIAPLLTEEMGFFVVSPETLWTQSDDGALTPNAFHSRFLEVQRRLRRPFVAHGLGLSPGSVLATELDRERRTRWLDRWTRDVEAFAFEWISEHLGFVAQSGIEAALPLPLPFAEEAIATVSDSLKALRQIHPKVALENSANAFAFGAKVDAGAFLNAILERADAHLVLDLHNLYVESKNFELDVDSWLTSIQLDRVIEIHVSGGSESEAAWLPSGRIFRLDSHDAAVPEPVWELLERIRPHCRNLAGIVVERLNGTLDRENLPAFREELERARSIFAAPLHPQPTAIARAAIEFPNCRELGTLQQLLIEAVTASAPETVIAREHDDLSGDLQGWLGTIDGEAFRLTNLLVRKLRFERITLGDADLERWFSEDSEAFLEVFRLYEQAGAKTHYFPAQEAAAFRNFAIEVLPED